MHSIYVLIDYSILTESPEATTTRQTDILNFEWVYKLVHKCEAP